MSGRLLPAGTYGLDDLAVGDRIETAGLLVSADMVDRFADLTGDRFAIHMEDAAARALGFPRRVAHGLLVLSLIDGLKNQAPAQFRAVASLGWEWSFLAPVYIGDRIRAELDVQSLRATSDGRRGIAQLAVTVRTGDGRVVQSGLNRLMILR